MAVMTATLTAWLRPARVGRHASIEQANHALRRVGNHRVVRHEHQRGAIAVELTEQLEQPLTRGRIELTGGLIGQQERGLVGEGARNRHALLFTTRQLRGAMTTPVTEPHVPQQVSRPRLACAPRHARFGQRQFHVLECRQGGHEIEPLKDEPDVA